MALFKRIQKEDVTWILARFGHQNPRLALFPGEPRSPSEARQAKLTSYSPAVGRRTIKDRYLPTV